MRRRRETSWKLTSFASLLAVVVSVVALRRLTPAELSGFLADLMAMTVVVMPFMVLRGRWASSEECERKNAGNPRHV